VIRPPEPPGLQDTIDQFYRNVVSPFVRDFEACRSDIRRAYGAVWALDSYASHIFYFYREIRNLPGRDDIDYKNNTLKPKSPDFNLISDVSAATKHAVRNRTASKIFYSSEVLSVSLVGWSAYFAQVEPGEWGDQVIIHNDQHMFVPLLPIALRAEAFLTSEKNELANHN
jgi:hypothetical protein